MLEKILKELEKIKEDKKKKEFLKNLLKTAEDKKQKEDILKLIKDIEIKKENSKEESKQKSKSIDFEQPSVDFSNIKSLRVEESPRYERAQQRTPLRRGSDLERTVNEAEVNQDINQKKYIASETNDKPIRQYNTRSSEEFSKLAREPARPDIEKNISGYISSLKFTEELSHHYSREEFNENNILKPKELNLNVERFEKNYSPEVIENLKIHKKQKEEDLKYHRTIK